MTLRRLEVLQSHGEETIKADIQTRITHLPEPSNLFRDYVPAAMATQESFTWLHPSNNFHARVLDLETNPDSAIPALQRFQLLYPGECNALLLLIQVTLRNHDNHTEYVLALEELKHAYAIMRHLVSTSDPHSDDPYFLRG